jgi:hypothetical protein
MNIKISVVQFFFLCTISSFKVFSQTWQNPVLVENYQGKGGGMLNFNSLTMVNNNPAIAYFDDAHRNLMYVRSNDSNGENWTTPQPILAEGYVGESCILRIVNGNPAICYMRKTSDDLMNIEYIRANDAIGSSWATPIILALDVKRLRLAFEIINGMPAISFVKQVSGLYSLNYRQASDLNGSTWDNPNTVTSNNAFGDYSKLNLMEINGKASLSYITPAPLKIQYIRATNNSGNSWGAPKIIETSVFELKLGNMAIINGRPAVCYTKIESRNEVKYIRADDIDGDTWGNSKTLASASFSLGIYTYLGITDGLPTVYYNGDSPSDVRFLRATDVDGTNDWGTPSTVFGMSGNTTFEIKLVNGNPASIGCYDEGCGYKRANNAIGSSWGTLKMIENTGNVGLLPNLKMINGFPSAIYNAGIGSGNALKFVKANSSIGASWSKANVVTPTISATSAYLFSSLNAVNGKPAIAFMQKDVGGLKYTQASNVSGTIWNNAVTLDANIICDYSPSIETINGNPAVSYIAANNSGNRVLKFTRANDSDGSSWTTSQIIDVNVQSFNNRTSLKIVNGNPAIAYSSADNSLFSPRGIQFIRASNSNGSAWNSPVNLNFNVNVWTHSVRLLIVNGNPAIVFAAQDNNIYYIKSNDINGTSWSDPQLVFTHSNLDLNSLDFEVYNNLPIITFITVDLTTGNRKLYSLTSDNAQGSSWGLPNLAYDIPYDNLNPFPSHSLAVLSPNQMGIFVYNNAERFPYFITDIDIKIPSLESILSAKVFLQGPYNAGSNLMNDDLRTKNLIPFAQPFSTISGFTHIGGGGLETITPSVLAVMGNDAIVDWVFIQLRDKNNAATVLATRAALLQRDGDIVDVDGTSPVTFNITPDNYYVAIRHRNHLGARTVSPIALTNTATLLDFTSMTTPSVVYGTNPLKDLGGGKLGLYMGNVIQDGILKYSGSSNDRLPILTKIGGANITATANGYFSEDCNMDGIVKYSGSSNDRLPILTNIGGTNITATIAEQL